MTSARPPAPIPAIAPASVQTTRRDFLAAGGIIVTMLALGAATRLHAAHPLLRPPGAAPESAFLSRCLRCDRCRGICPTAVIAVATVETGWRNTRTPVLDFHRGYCDFCGACVTVCPTRALAPFDTRTVRLGVAEVNDRCIARISGGCNVCGTQCPYNAITFDLQKRPIVDTHRCNGCGLCEKVCPALVLRAYSGGNERGIVVRPLSVVTERPSRSVK